MSIESRAKSAPRRPVPVMMLPAAASWPRREKSG